MKAAFNVEMTGLETQCIRNLSHFYSKVIFIFTFRANWANWGLTEDLIDH